MPPRIAVFTKNRTNPAYEAARFGANQIAQRFGAVTTHYVPVQPDNVTEQIALIKEAIAQRPDAAVFAPVHETEMNEAVLDFERAGIPVFSFVTRASAGTPVCFVGSDDRTLARNVGRYLFENLGGRGDIVIVEGTPASATSHERLKGFKDTLADYPGITVRASLCGQYQRDVARGVIVKAGDTLKGVDAILCANDSMALGVLDALDEWPPHDKRPLLVGVNAVPEAVQAIAAGKMLATVNFDAMAMCAMATEAALRHLRGERVPSVIMLPVEIVDAGNCAKWNLPFQKRPLPRWEDIIVPAAK